MIAHIWKCTKSGSTLHFQGANLYGMWTMSSKLLEKKHWWVISVTSPHLSVSVIYLSVTSYKIWRYHWENMKTKMISTTSVTFNLHKYNKFAIWKQNESDFAAFHTAFDNDKWKTPQTSAGLVLLAVPSSSHLECDSSRCAPRITAQVISASPAFSLSPCRCIFSYSLSKLSPPEPHLEPK